VSNIVAIFVCCPAGVVSIAGTVVSIIALTRCATQPDSARQLLRWAWILLGVSVAVGILIAVWAFSTGNVDLDTT
jgi:hypothetical protein